MGSLALQDIKGVISMVLNRSRLFSSAREAMIAGTVQPKPSSMGMNARPERPMLAHDAVHDVGHP